MLKKEVTVVAQKLFLENQSYIHTHKKNILVKLRALEVTVKKNQYFGFNQPPIKQ